MVEKSLKTLTDRRNEESKVEQRVFIIRCFNLKDKKWQKFLVIDLIEFIQSNNFHIYSIF